MNRITFSVLFITQDEILNWSPWSQLHHPTCYYNTDNPQARLANYALLSHQSITALKMDTTEYNCQRWSRQCDLQVTSDDHVFDEGEAKDQGGLSWLGADLQPDLAFSVTTILDRCHTPILGLVWHQVHYYRPWMTDDGHQIYFVLFLPSKQVSLIHYHGKWVMFPKVMVIVNDLTKV